MSAPVRPRPMVRRLKVVGRDLVRTFVVRPVRANVVRSHGGGLTAWVGVGLGVVAYVVVNVGVVGSSRWSAVTTRGRAGAVLGSSGIGAPLLVPSAFVPLLGAVMVIGTFLGLFGAVLARPATAALALGFVVATCASPAATAFDRTHPATVLPSVALLAALTGVLVMRRWRPPLPVVQVIAAVSAVVVIVPAFLLRWRSAAGAGGTLGWSLVISDADGITAGLAILVAPLVFLAGVGTVSFGVTVTEFLRRGVLTLSRGRWWVIVALFTALLAWRLFELVRQAVALPAAAWPGFAVDIGAALVLIGAASWWWRWSTHGSVDPAGGAAGATIPLMLGVLGLVLFTAVLSEVATVAATYAGSAASVTWADRVVRLAGGWAGTTLVPLLVGVVALAWAVRRTRREPGPDAGWVGIVGGLVLIRVLWGLMLPPSISSPGRISFAHATTLLALAGAVAMAIRAARGHRPGVFGLVEAGMVLTLTGLVAQNDFLSSPFAPFLGFTGIGFVLFGVVWGFLTSGGHSKATGLPGLGRTLIMLGYALLSTGLLVWGTVSGSPVINDNIGGTSSSFGRSYLGDALFLAFVAAWLPRVWAAPRPPRPDLTPADLPTVPIPIVGPSPADPPTEPLFPR